MLPCWTLVDLLFIASVASLRSAHYSLRERLPSKCGFAHYGTATGSAQRLVETHLAPGVADWKIVVPMPPPCAGAQLTGAHVRVCDADAPPHVAMRDALAARAHRTGQLSGFASVNVTVYCVLPPPPTTTSTTSPLSHLTYEMLSNELSSNEVTSNEATSYESESTDLKSTELTTTLLPTSSTTLSQNQEDTAAPAELTLSTEVVTAPPNNTTSSKEKTPQSMKVTINITPTNQASTEKDVSQSSVVELPSLSMKRKPDEIMSSQRPRFPSEPSIVTPPRISARPRWKHVKQPRGPGSPAKLVTATHRPPGASPHPGAHSPLGPQYTGMGTPYELAPPHPLAPVYRPLGLLAPRLTFLWRRQPLLLFRYF